MSARADIARAASTVTGVTVSPGYRQTLKAGEGFVRWAGRDRADDGLGFMERWQVWLAIPQDLGQAEDWTAARLDALVEALDSEVVVTSITPAELVLISGTTTNGLIIDGARPSGD